MKSIDNNGTTPRQSSTEDRLREEDDEEEDHEIQKQRVIRRGANSAERSYDTISTNDERGPQKNKKKLEKSSGINPIIVTTIGMVIHCVADGLALGTSVFCKLKIQLTNICLQ